MACTGGDTCGFCELVLMVNNIVEWLVIIVTTLTVLLIAFAGFRLITSGGDAQALQDAKKYLFNALIGILIILAGWTIVDTVLKLVAGGDLGVWQPLSCEYANPAGEIRDYEVTNTVNVAESRPAGGGGVLPVAGTGANGPAGGAVPSETGTTVPGGSAGTNGPAGGTGSTGNGSTGSTPLDITIGGNVPQEVTPITDTTVYTVNPSASYVIHEPAMTEYGIEAGESHGNAIEIVGVYNNRMLYVRDLVEGREYALGCQLVMPVLEGC